MNGTDETHSQPIGRSPDPYLRAFLREATTIIAIEKGINESSLARLIRLANELGISDEKYDESIERLKSANENLGLSRYEAQFVRVVEVQLQKLAGNVLSRQAEQRLIDLATKKFQIDDVKAYRLLQKTALKQGVSLISQADAIQFARRLAIDAIGGCTFVSVEDQSKLRRICRKWGLTEPEVDQIVTRKTRSNWRFRNLKRLAWGVTFCALLAAMWIIVGIVIKLSPAPNNSDAKEVVNLMDTEIDSLEFSEWWNPEMRAAALAIQGRAGDVVGLNDLVQNEGSSSPFLDAIENTLGVFPADPNWVVLLSNWAVFNPDSIQSQRAIDLVNAGLPLTSVEMPLSTGKIRRWLNLHRVAAEIISVADGNGIEIPQLASVRNQLKLGKSNDEEPGKSVGGLGAVPSNLVLELWQTATAQAKIHPRSIASVLDLLESFPAVELQASIRILRKETVDQILERDPLQWTFMKTSIARCIGNAIGEEQKVWLNRMQDQPVDRFGAFLRERLARNLKIDGEFLSREQLETQIANRLRKDSEAELLFRIESAIQMRKNEIIESGNSALDASVIQRSSLRRLAAAVYELVAMNNLLLSSHSTNGAPFLDWLIRFERKENPLVIADTRTLNDSSDTTPAQWRRFRKAFESLRESDSENSSRVVSAIESIGSLAIYVPDADRDVNAILLDLYFNAKNSEVSLAADRLLPKLEHWPRLRLELADGLADGRYPRSAVETALARIDSGFEPAAEKSIEQLRTRIVLSAIKILENRPVRLQRISVVGELEAQLELMWDQRIQILTGWSLVETRNRSDMDKDWLANLTELIEVEPVWCRDLSRRCELVAAMPISQLERMSRAALITRDFISRTTGIQPSRTWPDRFEALSKLWQAEFELYQLLNSLSEWTADQ